MSKHSCVSPDGKFVYGIHRPHFTAENFRQSTALADLGQFGDGESYRNQANFPDDAVHEPAADTIFEVPNALPFRGTTYINTAWADARAQTPQTIRLPAPPELSFSGEHADEQAASQAIRQLPRPLQLALAVTSTDARDLVYLAHAAGEFCMDEKKGAPWGLAYAKTADGRVQAVIADHELFEAVANNIHLPDSYKTAMVLRPGAQGGSEIVGETKTGQGHVYEYLRRNSYIPWGHYAANMADDAVRYRVADLTMDDMTALRHLYYQRSYTRLAQMLDLALPATRRPLTDVELEHLRGQITTALSDVDHLPLDRTLWGWNYGFDYAPSRYRLHASHQQIHQQFAMIPATVPLATGDGQMPSYACGDLVSDFVQDFRKETGRDFFACYQQSIRNNTRMDDRHGPASLVVFEDEQVLLFVPKAQTSQWELQLMPKADVGNILEADVALRRALDRAIHTAVQVLGALGARMITSIEYSKPLVGGSNDQRLLMAFLPRLPESPGAFSEAQLRWINGHYPEDFAFACRSVLGPDD